MRLIHYSAEPLHSVYSVKQNNRWCDYQGGRKPEGLWVSVEGDHDWPDYMNSRGDSVGDFATEIILSDVHHVLVVDTAEIFDVFHRAHAYGRDAIPRNNVDGCLASELIKKEVIDWESVGAKYQGIIIAPYRREYYLEGDGWDWYSGWDCASGCIWDADAVAKITQLSPTARAGHEADALCPDRQP